MNFQNERQKRIQNLLNQINSKKAKTDTWKWQAGRKGAWIELSKSSNTSQSNIQPVKIDHKQDEFSSGFVSRLQNL